MKINTKLPIKSFNGEVVQETIADGKSVVITFGKVISEILLQDKSGGKMKMFVMAQNFYNQDEVSLDSVDFNLVKTAIENSNVYNSNLVTGQILIYLDSLKEVTE